MKSIQAPSQAEIGLSSMVSILSNIALGTSTGNSFLNTIEKDIYNFREDTKTALVDILSVASKKYDAMRELIALNKIGNLFTNDIYELLSNKQNQDTPIILPTPIEIIKEKKKKEIIKPENNDSTNFLKLISGNVENIKKTLLKKSSGTKDDSEDKSKSVKGTFFGKMKEFSEALMVIKVNLTQKLIGSLSQFGDVYNEIIANSSSKKKTEMFIENMDMFSTNISTLTKKIKGPTLLLGALALTLGILSLSVMNPLFVGSIAVIGGLIYVLSKISNNKELNPGLDKFTIGIGILTVSMLMMKFIPWESGLKMIAFVAGINLVLQQFMKVGGGAKTDTLKNNPMIAFSVGIGILTASMLMMKFISWEAGLGMIVFIDLITISLNKFSMKGKQGIANNPIIMFALGVGILTLAMFAMNSIPWQSITSMILFIGGLGLVMKLFNFDKMGPSNSMVSFAFGFGLLVLAMYGINELPWETLAITIVFIGALGLVMKLFNFDKMGPRNAMVSFAFGFGIMVLAMYAIKELPWQTLALTLGFIGALGLVMKLFGPIQGTQFLMLSGGLIGIAGALWIFKQINLKIEDALLFGIIIVGLAGIITLIAGDSALIKEGSIALGIMSVATLISGLSLWLLSKLEFNMENILSFGVCVAILVIAYNLLADGVGEISLLGAGLFVLIAGATFLGGLAISYLSKMEFDVANITAFVICIGIITAGFALLALPAVVGLVGALAFIPIATASIVGALALGLISKTNIDTKKIDLFYTNAKKLVEGLNEIGSWDLVKTAAKSLLLLPVFRAAYLGAKSLESITSANIDNVKISNFGGVLTNFVDTISTVLSSNEAKLENAKPGIEALAKLMSVSSGIARTIQLMANMQFYEYGVKDGKLVLKGVRTLNADDFKRVGENLGTMLQCLIEPLTILGSDSTSFVIGGKVITNPFKSDTALKGIDLLSKIGNAFQPLAESVKTYSSLPMVSNPKLLSQFNNSLIVMTNVFFWMFTKLSTLDNSLITDSIGNRFK